MSDMDTRLQATFETFTDAELVDMVLDHSGTKSPKSQRIAQMVLDRRGIGPIEYPRIIEAAQITGEIGRTALRPAAMPRSLRFASWVAAAIGAATGFLVYRELVLAAFIGAMAGFAVATVGRTVRKRYLQRKGLGHALKA